MLPLQQRASQPRRYLRVKVRQAEIAIVFEFTARTPKSVLRHMASETPYPFTTVPPFGCSTWPVMNEESSDARNTYEGAISSGSPARLRGTSAPNFSTFSGGNVDGIRGVQTGPGATAFTRIPFSASDNASDRVNATIAPLVEE